jgi:hypothetical protein
MNVQIMWLNILMAVVPLGAKEWTPSEEFLKAVCTVESSGGQFVVGDNGRSLGEFQISEAAWLDVNDWRKSKGMPLYSYRNVFKPEVNRAYAADYLTILHTELRRKLKRPPSHSELYAAYNMGLASFANVNYQLHRVNRVTKAKCRQIDLMLASN